MSYDVEGITDPVRSDVLKAGGYYEFHVHSLPRERLMEQLKKGNNRILRRNLHYSKVWRCYVFRYPSLDKAQAMKSFVVNLVASDLKTKKQGKDKWTRIIQRRTRNTSSSRLISAFQQLNKQKQE